MHFNRAAAAALSFGLAGSASAVAIRQTAVPADGTPFNIMALRSASNIHFAHVDAAHRSLYIGLTDQADNAYCEADGVTVSDATFVLSSGVLSLYSTDDVPQEVYVVDNQVGYTSKEEVPPEDAACTGWTLDEVGDLTFNGQSLIACPEPVNEETGWSLGNSVWVGSAPADRTDCLGFSSRAVENKDPKKCVYSNA